MTTPSLSSPPTMAPRAITYPDGGTTPFKGGKLSTWEGGMRAPCVIRWPGHIKPGTVLNDIFSSLDWVPTFVEIAGGPKGDGLKKQIEKGEYPGIVKTTLDGVNQIDYLTGKSDKSARESFVLTTQASSRRRCGTRTGRCTSPWCPTIHQASSSAWSLLLDPGRQHQTRSVRDVGRRAAQDALRTRRSSCRSDHRLCLRLEHAADRSGAVAQAPSDLYRLPAVAGPGQLQSRPGHAAGPEDEKRK